MFLHYKFIWYLFQSRETEWVHYTQINYSFKRNQFKQIIKKMKIYIDVQLQTINILMTDETIVLKPNETYSAQIKILHFI